MLKTAFILIKPKTIGKQFCISKFFDKKTKTKLRLMKFNNK